MTAAIIIVCIAAVAATGWFILKKRVVEPEILDGPGMVYEGARFDDALGGVWNSTDGHYLLAISNMRSLTVEKDGKSLVDRIGFCHDNSEGELSGRHSLTLFANELTLDGQPYAVIKDMRYEDGRMIMVLKMPDESTEQLTFEKTTEPEESEE